MSGEYSECGEHTLDCLCTIRGCRILETKCKDCDRLVADRILPTNEWIKCSDRLPKISYIESDNEDDPYECYPVLVYSVEKPGIFCVAYLEQNQDEDDWNFEDLFWQLYIPGEGRDIINSDLKTFDYWMPLPSPPKENDERNTI